MCQFIAFNQTSGRKVRLSITVDVTIHQFALDGMYMYLEDVELELSSHCQLVKEKDGKRYTRGLSSLIDTMPQ